jgi:hypothetical protein
MSKLTKFHYLEAGIWATLALVFFAYSFEFNQNIEIYKFGATGWPRAILLMLVLVLLGNLFYQHRHGSDAQAGRVGITDDDLANVEKTPGSILNIIAFILLPLIYAWSLKPVGFYSATPFFAAFVIMLLGERRPKYIIGISLLIYTLLIGLFMVVLNAPLPQGTVSPFYDFSAFMLRTNTQLQHLF